MNKGVMFLILVVANFFLSFSVNFILDLDLYTPNDLSNSIGQDELQELTDSKDSWAWLFYVFKASVLLVTVSFSTFLMAIGVYMYSDRFRFKTLFGVATIGQFVFLLPSFIKIIWFSLFNTDYSYEDVKEFYPLSIYSFFEPNSLDFWLEYALRHLNLFEVIYCVVIYKSVEEVIPSSGLWAVVSYVTGLLIWVAIVMFLTLTYN